MKKIVSLLLVLMLAVGMVGCGNSSDSSDTSATSAAQESDKKDAVVVDTTILKEADDDMLNTYTVIAVNPDAPLWMPMATLFLTWPSTPLVLTHWFSGC